MRILAVDPGLATGAARWTDERGFNSEIWEYPDVMDRLENAVPFFDLVVCESFVVTQRTLKLSRQYHALELIGLIRFLCRRHHVELQLQSPSDAKAFVKNDRLRALDWYKPGAGHDNDAARHLLLGIARNEKTLFEALIREGGEVGRRG